MSGEFKNRFLWAAVILLTIIPLLTIRPQLSGPDGRPAEIFTGADRQAEGVIKEIAPGYQPWFTSLIKPPSSEIESLLFALQAALGAGVIGYYAGYVRGKRKAESLPRNGDDRAH